MRDPEAARREAARREAARPEAVDSDEIRPDDIHPLLRPYEGRPAAVAGQGRDPVNAPMIRHWCEALGDTGPAYAGSDPVAPATMLQVWIMPGLLGQPARSPAYDELLGLLQQAGYTAVLATDCEQEYLRALRPGDVITFDAVIETVSPRKITKRGAGYFLTTRTEIRANGELAGIHRFRIFRYAPATAAAPATSTAPAQGAPAQAAPAQAAPAQAAPAQAAPA
ncbi:FAS1-like dehydratase domain-containing protein, partial [Streptomyces stramineus]